MNEETIILRLRRDQVFGLHANVPESMADAACAALKEALLEFSRAWPGTERLHEPGRITVFVFDAVEDVRLALSDSGRAIQLADEMELLPPRYEGRFAKLLDIGQPSSSADEPEGCETWGFTAEDIPALVGMMTDDELHGAASDTEAVWGPIHAIRALGWLRAEAAIEPLVAEWRRIEVQDDDFLGSEVAAALAIIGPASLAPAASVLADETRSEQVRLHAARTMAKLAQKHREIRAPCIDALVAQLNAHPIQEPEFNGMLVSALLDAHAVEAAVHLERAFASGRVDETIAGDWEDVQIELGLKLRRERPPKPNRLTAMGAQLRESFGLPEPADPDDFSPAVPPDSPAPQPFRAAPKIGRNDPCPCGSGKKYKKCCGG